MAKPFKCALCWVRRDLRLHDHAALAAATAQAERVAVVFVFDTNILDPLEDRDDRRLTFIMESLREMDRKLRERGSLLLTRIGRPEEEIPKLARETGAEAVFIARDYEPYARERDGAIAKTTRLETVKDSVIREAGEVLTLDGRPFRAFAPYLKSWRKGLDPARDAAELKPDLDALWPADELTPHARPYGYDEIGFKQNTLWTPPGEDAGRARMLAFAKALDRYAETRNDPDGTSALSVHFRFGTISLREAVRLALEHGGERWLGEIVWREFFADVLFHFPEVAQETFKPQFRNVAYPGTEETFRAWTEGRTGYPLVDAAMRHLHQTGFMPNRMRIVVASFLCKDLLHDYRRGEAHFARTLLDFDQSTNNGNWQWSASTGTDAQPYFRIFNPVAQSERYDPDGAYIRRFVPELAALKAPAIHAPWTAKPAELAAAGVVLGETYPWPIVDHATQREKAKELLRTAAQAA